MTIRDERDLGAFIPSHLDDYGLNADEFRIYAHIARRAGSGTFYESIQRTAEHCKMDAKTVRKAVLVLRNAGLIKVKDRAGTTNEIWLTKHTDWVPPDKLDAIRKSTTPTKSGTTKNGRGTKNGTTKNGTPPLPFDTYPPLPFDTYKGTPIKVLPIKEREEAGCAVETRTLSLSEISSLEPEQPEQEPESEPQNPSQPEPQSNPDLTSVNSESLKAGTEAREETKGSAAANSSARKLSSAERFEARFSGHKHPGLLAEGLGHLWVGPGHRDFDPLLVKAQQAHLRKLDQEATEGRAKESIANYIYNGKWAVLEQRWEEAQAIAQAQIRIEATAQIIPTEPVATITPDKARKLKDFMQSAPTPTRRTNHGLPA